MGSFSSQVKAPKASPFHRGVLGLEAQWVNGGGRHRPCGKGGEGETPRIWSCVYGELVVAGVAHLGFGTSQQWWVLGCWRRVKRGKEGKGCVFDMKEAFSLCLICSTSKWRKMVMGGISNG